MSAIIHLTADAEPLALHGVDYTGDTQIFGVHLALQVKHSAINPSLAPEQVEAQKAVDEAEGRAETASFLQGLPTGTFRLLEIDRKEFVAAATTITPVESQPSGDILDWLDRAKEGFAELQVQRVKSTGPRAAGGTRQFYSRSTFAEDVSFTSASAFDLLRATAKWPAPLAQRPGLMRAVQFDFPLDPTKKYALVYVPVGEAPELHSVSIMNEDVTLVLKIGTDDAGNPVTRTQMTNLLTAYDEAANTELGLQNTGVFTLSDGSEERVRLLTRIEEQAPTLLWPATTLGSMALDPEFAARFLAGGDQLTKTSDLPRAVLDWILKASVVSLFDIAISGLLLPTLNDVPPDAPPVIRRQSTVLQRLSRRIVARFDAAAEAAGNISPVKEAEVYKALHVALHTGLTGITAGKLPDQVTKLLPDKELPISKAALATTPQVGDGVTVTWEVWQEHLRQFSGEMGDLALALEGEEGAESWMLARFEGAFTPLGKVFSEVAFNTGIEAAEPNEDKRSAILADIWKDFVADITGPFDAAEAVRRDFGADVVAAVQAIDDLAGELPSQPFFLSRFPTSDDELDQLFRHCVALDRPKPPEGASMPDPATVLAAGLMNFGNQRLKELVAVTEATALFRPDAAPQPLHLPLLDRADTDTLNALAERISGLGYLVAGSFDDNEMGVPDHACLIEVSLKHEGPGAASGGAGPLRFVTVEPVLPAPTPGTRGLFLSYEGQPVSSPSRAEPGTGGARNTPAEKEALAGTKAYVRAEAEIEVDKPPTPPHQTDIKVPELSYGAYYAAAGFWVPPSGVLPHFLRAAAATPPTHDGAFLPTNPAAGEIPLTAPLRYQRRTAISETTVLDPQAGRPLARGLHPLSLDDPRIVVERQPHAERHVDLYRRQDGTGALTTGKYLLHLRLEGADAVLAPEGTTVLTLSGTDLGGLAFGDLSVHPKTEPEKDEQETAATLDHDTHGFTFSVLAGKTAWLRLSLRPGTPAAISFDDPAHDRGQDSAGRSGGLILLAPEDEHWTEPQERIIQLAMPRVSFLDLERWASNTALWSETSGLAREDAKGLLDDLRKAQAIYEALPGAAARSYAEKLNALPDPAVAALYIGAAIADGVNRSQIDQEERSVGEFVRLSPYAGASRFDFSGLEAVLGAEEGVKDASAIVAAMEKVGIAIDHILRAGKVEVTLSGGKEGARLSLKQPVDGTVALAVPSGQIARLWVSPAVQTSLIAGGSDPRLSGIFDPRMEHLSCGSFSLTTSEKEVATTYKLFDGVKLTVEVMAALNVISFATSPIAAQALGTERGYAVTTRLTADQRIYSQAVLTTQRWRTSGRPIYTYIDPAPDTPPDGPVIVVNGTAATGTPKRNLDTQELKVFEAFEDEAFAGRQSGDGEVTQVRLLPAPDVTQLWQFEWPEAAATYLRHSAVLWSRYAAAVRKGKKVTATVHDDRPFVLSVAILADPVAATPTRPQLRAYLPMQRRVDEDTGWPQRPDLLTPPIACVLHEPPHAQLGLADRLAADLVYTEVFKVDPVLKLDDLRKEIGPDPLLSWWPIEGEKSKRCRIEVEGPVGLHYEGPATLAPAFPNSQYLLQPVTDADFDAEQKAELEESFAGISLSRFTDPSWVWQRQGPDNMRPTMTEECWIDLGEVFDLKDGAVPILSRAAGDAVRAAREALYEKGGADMVDIAPADVDALLLKPLDPERLRVSLFRSRETDRRLAGQSNRPELLGSVILRITAALSFTGAVAIRAVRQSEATFARWVKTNRDMGQLIRVVDDQSEGPIPVAQIVARRGSGGVRLGDAGSAIISPVSRRRYPLHVHRRLVQLLRKHAPQIGAPVPLFHRALLTDGTGRSQTGDAAAADSLQLAEMETRACIHVVENAGRPPGMPHLIPYHLAIFDLVGSRRAGGIIRQLRLFVRSANGPLSLSGLRLTLDLKLEGTEDSVERPVDLAALVPEVDAVQTMEIVIFDQDDAGDLHYTVQVNNGDFASAKVLDPPVAKDSDVWTKAGTVELVLSNNDDRESWTDISILQGEKAFSVAEPHAFDFDWVFGGEDLTLPDALDPQTLNALPEVQARFVGMTRPIQLDDSI